MTARPQQHPVAGDVVGKLRRFKEMLFYADALSTKPTAPNEVETTKITTRESHLLQYVLGEAIAALEAVGQSGEVERGALRDIADERQRQIEGEGWTPEHDDEHSNGELARAAACYALGHGGWDGFTHCWPWDRSWWKPTDRRRSLVKAGALIAAEIERLDRASSPTPGEAE